MHEILSLPIFYNLYQNIIGCQSFLKRYANDYLKIEKNQSVLDLGCGTANIVPYLPKDINYTGIDYSKKYIDYARKKYSKSNPNFTFINKGVNEDFNFDTKFDVFFGEAILSGINDAQAEKMFASIKKYAKPNSKIIFSDMNYLGKNSKIETFLFRCERNSYLRTKNDYIQLLSKHFTIDKILLADNIYIIPYSKLVFECHIKK